MDIQNVFNMTLFGKEFIWQWAVAVQDEGAKPEGDIEVIDVDSAPIYQKQTILGFQPNPRDEEDDDDD